jgi:hypothetical protein
MWQDRREGVLRMMLGRRTRRSDRVPRLLGQAAGAVLGAAIAAACLAAPAGAVTTTFLDTGAQQKFVVPAGVTSLHVLAVGARGGNGLAPGGGLGGAPAEDSGDLEVFPGQTLYVEVGGVGTEASFASIARAFNGGNYAGMGTAGGGGASDVRLLSRPENDTPLSLFSRLIVAAGGGGGGAGSGGTSGGAGGQAGSAGGSSNGGEGGGPGTEEAPGTSVLCGKGCEGKLGAGAEGSIGLEGSGGGGGAGGLFGGAGGSSNVINTGGGGGGGSSLHPLGGQTVVPATLVPQVQISFTPPTGGPPFVNSPPANVPSAFSLLRPIVGVGNSITLVLDLPGKGTATALATATREVVVRRHGKRIHKKVRFSYGTAHATAASSGALELTIKPSATGKKALAANRRLSVAIVVGFTPAGVTPPPAASKRLTVTLVGTRHR